LLGCLSANAKLRHGANGGAGDDVVDGAAAMAGDANELAAVVFFDDGWRAAVLGHTDLQWAA